MKFKSFLPIFAAAAMALANATTDPLVREDQTVQDLRKTCECAPAQVPPYLSEKSKCEFLANHEVLCYKQSNGGCPEPEERDCSGSTEAPEVDVESEDTLEERGCRGKCL